MPVVELLHVPLNVPLNVPSNVPLNVPKRRKGEKEKTLTKRKDCEGHHLHDRSVRHASRVISPHYSVAVWRTMLLCVALPIALCVALRVALCVALRVALRVALCVALRVALRCTGKTWPQIWKQRGIQRRMK